MSLAIIVAARRQGTPLAACSFVACTWAFAVGLLDFRRQELSQPAYYVALLLCSAGKLSYFRISVDAFVATLELEFHRSTGGLQMP